MGARESSRSSYPAVSLALLLLGTLGVAAIVLLTPRTGRAAFPGANGDIAFYSDRDGDDQIFRTGSAVPLTSAGRNYSPAWSPDGTRIAFVSQRDIDAEIYVMNADGTQQKRLTTDPARKGFPTWSADGSKIAFGQWDGEPDTYYKIWTVDPAGGSDPVVLIDMPGGANWAAFSPDGSKIAFAHNVGERQEIYVADSDGSNATPLTSNAPDSRTRPNWSPDGARIVYSCPPASGPSEICVMDADGGSQMSLTTDGADDRDPVWSPDGTRIAFESYREAGSPGGIYTMNPAGGDVQLVTLEGDYDPDWQPLSVSPTATTTATATASPTPTHSPSANLIQGDVNCDGVVDEEDFAFMIQYFAGLNDGMQPDPCPDLGEALPAADGAHPWGDVNCDDAVNPLDALYVLAHTTGIELPHVGCVAIGQEL